MIRQLACIAGALGIALATGCSQLGEEADADAVQQQQLQRSMTGQQSPVIPDAPAAARNPVPGEYPDTR